MDYQVSARKYRPGTFDDVVGQGHVVQTLVNAITTKRVAHAFLFSGTRGVGKTTVARILAKALNCEQGATGTPCNVCPNCLEIAAGTSVDVIEIDGASNTSVDDVREVRENVKFAPFRGRYRVYIIDEVHMLSTSAFNALLKTLEEPPAHVVFVFATTEIHKIPATILSRCQHYNFRRISRTEIVERLRHVAREEGLEIEERSLAALARASEGSMRDALSLLDQAVAFSGKRIGHPDLEVLLGTVPREFVDQMVAAIVSRDAPAALRVIATVLDQGHDLRVYCRDLVEVLRNMLVASVVPSEQDLASLIETGEDERRQIVAQAKALGPDLLQELFKILSQAEDSLRFSVHPRFVLEVAAVKATRPVSGEPAEPRPAASVQPPAKPAARPAATGFPPAPPPPAGASAPAAPPSQPPTPQAGRPARPAPAGTRTTAQAPSGTAPVAPQPDRKAPPSRSAPPVEPSANAAVEPRAPRASAAGEPAAPPDRSLGALDWEQVQNQVDAQYPSIAPFLERGFLVGVEGNQVSLGFSKADTVARAVIERAETLQTLAELCTSLAGQAVRVRVVELGDGQAVGPRRSDRRAAEEKEQKVVLLERTRAHPLVKETLALFGGDVVEVRRAPAQKEVRE